MTDQNRTEAQLELIEFLTSTPTLEQIACFQFSEAVVRRISLLMDAKQHGTLTDAEFQELDTFIQLNRLVRDLTKRAQEKLT